MVVDVTGGDCHWWLMSLVVSVTGGECQWW